MPHPLLASTSLLPSPSTMLVSPRFLTIFLAIESHADPWYSQ
jgi:hypothetical protein